MKKIEFKVNADKLNIMIEALNYMSATFVQSQIPSAKMIASIVVELLKLLSKKNIDKLDVQKQFKLSFKYYQAYVLCEMLQKYSLMSENVYTRTVLDKIVTQIDTQL